MTEIYLIRHGQASLGATDYDQLSNVGIQQASLLGRWLAERGISVAHAAYGRPRRHIQTAEALFESLPVTLHEQCRSLVEPAFDEFDYRAVLVAYDPVFDLQPEGAFGGLGHMSAEEFKAHFSRAFERWVMGRHDSEYRLSWSEFKARCVKAVREIVKRCAQNENAIVVTSAGPISAIYQHYLGVSNECVDGIRGGIFNTSVTRLSHRQGQTTLAEFNSIAHLARATDDAPVTLL